jgi:hypothetical protein
LYTQLGRCGASPALMFRTRLCEVDASLRRKCSWAFRCAGLWSVRRGRTMLVEWRSPSACSSTPGRTSGCGSFGRAWRLRVFPRWPPTPIAAPSAPVVCRAPYLGPGAGAGGTRRASAHRALHDVVPRDARLSTRPGRPCAFDHSRHGVAPVPDHHRSRVHERGATPQLPARPVGAARFGGHARPGPNSGDRREGDR